MSNPIDPTSSVKLVAPQRVTPAKSSSPSSGSSSASSNDESDSVHLTGGALQISDLSQAISRSPAVNVKHVAAVRQAIASGQYAIDDRSVAARLVTVDRSLGQR